MEKIAEDINTAEHHADFPAKKIIQQLAHAVGITINGPEPWDIHVHHRDFYNRVLHQGALGLGESYMDKWWDCERLDVLFDKILTARLDTQIKHPTLFRIKQALASIVNLQTKQRSKQVADQHYDLGNTLFKAMLDSRMVYSCGYWKDATDLEEAQIAKLDLICRKLRLQPGMHLLDIGCGWGGLAKYAAQHYNVAVTGLTISKQQYQYARDLCADLPVDIRLMDYRDIKATYDRIVSVGMFEHVGHLNFKPFMQIAHRALKKDGLMLLHTIGANEKSLLANEWITKYIFPNGMLPTIEQIGHAYEKLFVMEDWHNFGAYYDPTLMAWYENFNKNWPTLSQYDERFYRMWRYYLLSCAGSFRARVNQLWQIVFSKKGVKGGYQSIR